MCLFVVSRTTIMNNHVLHYPPLLKKTCVRQIALDKWFPLTSAAAWAPALTSENICLASPSSPSSVCAGEGSGPRLSSRARDDRTGGATVGALETNPVNLRPPEN